MIPLTENTVGIALVIGLVLWVGWISAILLGFVWKGALGWIDDGDKVYPHPLLWILRLETYSTDRIWTYIRRKGSDKKGKDVDDVMIMTCFLGWAVFPVACFGILILLHFYALPLTILGLIAVANVARVARRSKKLFEKHIKDPSAHSASQ